MPQYPFIFIGSILAILSINIGCKAPDSSSKSNIKGKKFQEENNQKEEPKLRVGYTLYNVPTIVAAGSDSGFFYGFDTPAKTDSQVKNLQNFEKNIQISITKDGEDSDLKIKAVEKTNPILFYFNVPKSTPLGNYNVILNSNKFPNIKKSYSFKVVDEKKLDPTTIKSIQIKSLQQFRLNHNFNIPKGKCIDLLVTAETSTDQIVYNITNENWLIKNINSQVTNFTLTKDMKICAYHEKYGSKYLPKAGDETQFKISHAGKDFIAKFIATENLEKASGQEDTASKSSDPETSLPPLDALVTDEVVPSSDPIVTVEVVPIPEPLVTVEVVPAREDTAVEPLGAEQQQVTAPDETPVVPLVAEQQQVPAPDEAPVVPLVAEQQQVPAPDETPVVPLVAEQQQVPAPDEAPVVPLVAEQQQVPAPDEAPVVPLVAEQQQVPAPEDTAVE